MKGSKNITQIFIFTQIIILFLLSSLWANQSSQTIQPGQVTVTLNIEPAGLSSSCAIESYIPNGLNPFNITNDGLWLKNKRRLRWGAFIDGQSKTLSYQLTGMPSPYTYDVINEISMDGQASLIPGTQGVLITSSFDTCTRHIQSQTKKVSVEIEIAHSHSNAAFAVIEVIPQNLAAKNISENGQWLPENREIRWGPFLDQSAKTLSYDLVGPTNTYSLNGVVSIDGHAESIAGDSDIQFSSCPLSIEMSKQSEGEYKLKLMAVCENSSMEIPNGYTIVAHDPSLVDIQGSHLTALENTRVTLTVLYQDQMIEKTFWIKAHFEIFELERNDIMDNASLMTELQFMEGEMLIDDIDYFQLNLEENAIIELAYLASSSTADVQIELLDNTAQVLLSGVSMDGQNISFFPALDKGVYYIKLTSAGDIDQNALYDLVYRIIRTLPPPVIPISAGETQQGQIYHINHTQVFTFDLYKTVVSIQFESGSSIAGYEISVVDSDDNVIEQKTVEPSGTVSFAPIDIAGNYMIKVIHHSGQIDAIHPFSVTLEILDYMAEVEPNNDFWQPTPIFSGERIKGQNDTDNDVDIFKFVLDADTPINLTLESDTHDMSAGIYYENELNHLYSPQTYWGSRSLDDFWKAGEWYVKISTDQIYYLSIVESQHQINAMEPDNKFITANEINGITEVHGVLPTNSDIDYFKYHCESSGAVEIYLKNESNNLTIAIFKDGPTQKILLRDVYKNNMIFIPLGLTYGDYYIQISYTKINEFSGDIPYQLNVYPTNKTYEIEPNDTFQQANNLNTDEPVNAQLSTTMDVDIFSVDVFSTQYYVLTCESETGNHPIQMQLIRASDMYTILDIPVLANQPFHLPMGLSTGRYFIMMATTVANQAYELKLASTENIYEILPNNSFENASPVISETNIAGALIMNQKDYYSFQIPAPMFIGIDFESTKDKVVSIFQNDETHRIDEMHVKADSQNSLSLGLGKGIYYMQVSATAGSSTPEPYSFIKYTLSDTQMEIESNNTPRVATPISKDNWKKGRLFSKDDQDWYGFALPEITRFLVDFASDSSDGDYLISIINKENNLLVSKTSIDGQSVTLRAYQEPGVYYILVESGETNDPESYYTLHIRADADVNPHAEIDGNVSIIGLRLAADKEQIAIGDSVQLTVVAHYSDASTEIVENAQLFMLSTKDSQPIARIENNQTIKGLANGYASIVASYQGLTGRLTLLVGQPGNDSSIFNHHGNLILVAGGGIESHNTLKVPTQYLANLVYQRFYDRYFANDDIYYFNPKTWHDIDGDGIKDNIVDKENISLTAFQNSITEWAVSRQSDGPLYVYLIDHGGIDTFKLFPNVNLSASNLDDYLDIFQNKTGRAVVVVIEACKSGSFVDDLMTDAKNRIVITSADHRDSYMHLDGSISFTQFFADYLYEGNSFQSSFDRAQRKLQWSGIPYKFMNPQLSESKLGMASTVIVGGPFAVASLTPEIVNQSNGDHIPLNTSKELFVELSDMFGIKCVTAVIVPPDYEIPETGDEFDAPIVTHSGLTLTDPEMDGRFTGTYDQFNQTGRYGILFYAQNINDHVSVSQPTMIIVGDVSQLPGDFNWDGQRNLEDVVMGLQILSGIPTGLYPMPDALRLSDVVALFGSLGLY